MKFLNILLVIFFVKQKDKGKKETTALQRSRSEVALLLSLYILIFSMLFKESIETNNVSLTYSSIGLAILLYILAFYGVYVYCWDLEQINDYLSDVNNDAFIYKYTGWSSLFYIITIAIFLLFLNI